LEQALALQLGSEWVLQTVLPLGHASETPLGWQLVTKWGVLTATLTVMRKVIAWDAQLDL